MDRWELEDLKAVALRYREKEDYAPVVLAKGRGYLAEAILALARQAGVPVLEEPELLQLLERWKWASISRLKPIPWPREVMPLSCGWKAGWSGRA